MELLKQEIGDALLEGDALSPAPEAKDEGVENDAIRAILEDIKERWTHEDRGKALQAAAPPRAAVPSSQPGGVTVETVILRTAPAPVPSPPAPPEPPEPPPDDAPTTILRVGPAAPAPPQEQPVLEDLEKTVVLRPEQLKGKGGKP